MPPSPLVTAVVPTYERRESLRRLLEALRTQQLPTEQFEVVVVVDGSHDGSFEMATGVDVPYALRVLQQPNRGRAAACNAGIRTARGGVVVLLDDDMEPTPSCLAAHLKAHPPGTRRCVVGSAPMRLARDAAPSAVYIAQKFNEHLDRIRRPNHSFGVRDFYSGNASIRRALLDETGAFDETFTAYGNEDLELALRLRAAGVEIRFAPDAIAWQHYTKSFARLAADTRAEGWTAVQLAVKHPTAFAGLQLAAYRAGPRSWRILRGALLAASRRNAAVPRLVMAVTHAVERRRVRRVTVYYRHVLEYFFWLGALDALREPWAAPVRDLAAPAR